MESNFSFGQIKLVDLNPTKGVEMNKVRPCVILSPEEMNDSLRTIIVAPITSTLRAIPTRVLVKATLDNNLDHDSYVVLDQIKTLDRMRIIQDLGHISENEKRQISETLCEMFSYE